MNLCVFQGTFNPIHNAHIRLVDYILKKYNFNKLLVIPACTPPHKICDTKTAKHRLEMTKIAFKNYDKVEVSDIEYKREGKSYTYLTILELYDKYQPDEKINFIIGTDAFDNIEFWYEAENLKKIVNFIIFKREESFNKNKYDYLVKKGYNFAIEDLVFEDISSSALRDMIKNGENIDKYIPADVGEYIKENELYKD